MIFQDQDFYQVVSASVHDARMYQHEYQIHQKVAATVIFCVSIFIKDPSLCMLKNSHMCSTL